MSDKEVRAKSAGLNSSQTTDTDCLADVEFSGLVARRNTIKYDITFEPARAPSRQGMIGSNVAARAAKSDDHPAQFHQLSEGKPKTPRVIAVQEKSPCINTRSASIIKATTEGNLSRSANGRLLQANPQRKEETYTEGKSRGLDTSCAKLDQNSGADIDKEQICSEDGCLKPKDPSAKHDEDVSKSSTIFGDVKTEIPQRPCSRMIKVKPAQTTAIKENITGSRARPDEPHGGGAIHEELPNSTSRNRRSVKGILRRVLRLFAPCYRPSDDDGSSM